MNLPAYTPSAGKHIWFDTSVLAVGNPMVRPRLSPFTTTPRTENGRPSNCCATSTCPPASARRIAVLLTGSATPSGRGTNCIGTTSKSYCFPSSRINATLPPRLYPKWKSSPTTINFAPSASTNTRFANAAGSSFEDDSSKCTMNVASMPVPASSSIFWSLSVSNFGADSGRTTDAG